MKGNHRLLFPALAGWEFDGSVPVETGLMPSTGAARVADVVCRCLRGRGLNELPKQLLRKDWGDGGGGGRSSAVGKLVRKKLLLQHSQTKPE